MMLIAFCPPGVAQLDHATRDSIITTTHDGVMHHHIMRPSGPWNIHALAVDLKNPQLLITSARALDSVRGREKVSSIVQRRASRGSAVIAAVNADFFSMQTGENDLSQIIDGEIVYAVRKPFRAQFAIGASGRPYIERFAFDGKLIAAGSELSVEAVNSVRDSAATVLFNGFARSYIPRPNDHLTLLKPAGRIHDTLLVRVEDLPTNADEIRLSDTLLLLKRVGDAVLPPLNPGDTAKLLLRFVPDHEPLQTLVGGLPRLVVNGKNFATTDSLDRLSPRFTASRHPRAGIGFSRDSSLVFLVTVDGRQASSAGMTLAEVADLMIELGCYQALNLDGGGSTTMVINGKVVNRPSDPAGERPVANALLVVKRSGK